MTYTEVIKVEREGKWVEVKRWQERDSNPAYPGDSVYEAKSIDYRCLKTRTIGNIRYLYSVPESDKRLRRIPRIICEVLWDNGDTGRFCCSPKEYLEEKKCFVYGRHFFMGKILQRTNTYDVIRQSFTSVSATCMI